MWRDLSNAERDALYERHYIKGERVEDLAKETGDRPETLGRYLRFWREYKRGETRSPSEKKIDPVVFLEAIRGKKYVTIDELSEKFDRSRRTIIDMIRDLQSRGYAIRLDEEEVSIDALPVERLPTLLDHSTREIVFGVVSDLHAGSLYAQPSNLQAFIETAYDEYGVRHIFIPGDLTTGVNGYRGHDEDLVAPIRGVHSPIVTHAQVALVDMFLPKLDGLKYYAIGGNHDYWHVVSNGLDPIAILANKRDDFFNLGYTVADVPLTERVYVRLFHPKGGVPYAASYRAQKTLEQVAYEELSRAIMQNDNPLARIILMGHLHIEVKLTRWPMVAAQVGCFEGRTNYIKERGLFPQIGGCIFRLRLTNEGKIQRVDYTFIPLEEIEGDAARYDDVIYAMVNNKKKIEIGVLFEE